jgi:outer membrane protein with beta-barrel domain
VRYSAVVRNLFGLVTALISLSAVCSAQSVTSGTFQLAGQTGVLINRQTISVQDPTGRSGDVDFTSANLGVEGTYYITPRLGIGGLVSYQRLSFAVPAKNAVLEISGGYFGPLVQVRLPLGDRSEFVFVGSDGGVNVSLTNQNTGVSSNVASHANGRYWLAGGGLSFFLRPNASFDLGVRYQSSTFTGQNSQQATAAGLLVGIAFSLYIN